MKALAIAATGMNAQQTNLEVIANNIANINTTGFKRARAEFSDLLYQVERLQGVPNRANAEHRAGRRQRSASASRPSAVRNLHIQGALTSTGNKFDLALTGRGWFQIEGADGETLYTRAGSFNTNATGQLVTVDGYRRASRRSPCRPTRSRSSSTRSGQVFARIDGQTELQDLGQLTLANFANEAGLAPLGDNLFQETAASGAGQCRRARRSRLRHDPAGLSRELQRRSGQGNHRADLGAARLRDELQGHPGRRRNGRRGLEEHQVTTMPSRRIIRGLRCSASLAALLGAASLPAAAQELVRHPEPRHLSRRDRSTADALKQVTLKPRQGAAATRSPSARRGTRSARSPSARCCPAATSRSTALREAYLVEQGAAVQVIFVAGALTISATAVTLQPGSAGDLVKVRNVDSGKVFSGTVMADGTIRVGAT